MNILIYLDLYRLQWLHMLQIGRFTREYYSIGSKVEVNYVSRPKNLIRPNGIHSQINVQDIITTDYCKNAGMHNS